MVVIQDKHGILGGIDLNFSLDKLLANVQSYLDMGLNGAKIKIEQPGLLGICCNLSRSLAYRLVYPALVDANCSMNVEEAIEAARALPR